MAGLTGCLGDVTNDPSEESDPGTRSDTDGTDSPEPGTTGATGTDDGGGKANFGIDHPGMTGAENDPVIGPPPDEAEMGLLMFTEPSCPYCREWHNKNWDQMQEELIDPGRLSVLVRPYPKVEEWAKPVAYAMLEIGDRDEEAFVTFMEWAYTNYGEFSVVDAAETSGKFLNENTSVDGDAVAKAVNEFDRIDDLMETMEAARSAGMTTIPGYGIIRDGEMIETTSGATSYSNMKRMLGAD